MLTLRLTFQLFVDNCRYGWYPYTRALLDFGTILTIDIFVKISYLVKLVAQLKSSDAAWMDVEPKACHSCDDYALVYRISLFKKPESILEEKHNKHVFIFIIFFHCLPKIRVSAGLSSTEHIKKCIDVDLSNESELDIHRNLFSPIFCNTCRQTKEISTYDTHLWYRKTEIHDKKMLEEHLP